MSRLILFHFTFLCLLLRRNWKMPISSHWNNSVFCDQWKMMSYLNMSYGKISHLCSLTHEAKKFRFWKPLKYLFFYKKRYDADLNMSHGKRYDADLNMSHGKMPDFVSLPLFGFTLVIKQRNLNFKSHWNTLILSWATKMMSDLNMSCQCLISFRIRCLCSILVILSWEVGI